MKRSYDPTVFTNIEGIDPEEYLICTYYMETATSDLLRRAEAVVLEQTTGTWVEVPEETEEVRRRHAGRVLGVHELPGYEDFLPEGVGERKFIFEVAYPISNIGGQIPELLTTLLGNISMAGKLKLLDVRFPAKFVKGFGGPKFGVGGVRDMLKVHDRPLICAMIKPCVGIPPKTVAKLFYDLAVAGVDVVKDDELLADPKFCSFEDRLKECMGVEEKVYRETGRHTLYAINVTDSPQRMIEKAERAVERGANTLMVNTFAVGLPALSALAENPKIKVPLLSHPAFSGVLFEDPYRGMSSDLVLGKLNRLAGADMMIYPSPYGKVRLLKERCIRVAQVLTSPFHHLKPVFPGPSAGIHPGHVPNLVGDFGDDLIIGAGGGIHGHPDGPRAGVKAFYQALTAFKENVPLNEAAKDHPELRVALAKWGVFDEKGAGYSLLT